MADPDYFTLAEFRALPDCSGNTYTDAQINAAAAYFTAIVERELGQPMIPRDVTQTLDGNYSSRLLLSSPYVRSITTVTVGGTTVSPAGLTASAGVLRYLDGTSIWTGGVANIVVTYSAGQFDECPADIKDAVLWATRDRLMSQSDQAGVDVRRTSITTDFGTTNYILPGEKRPTGYPDLDAAIAGRLRTAASLGFA
jgi:hypothetical protein